MKYCSGRAAAQAAPSACLAFFVRRLPAFAWPLIGRSNLSFHPHTEQPMQHIRSASINQVARFGIIGILATAMHYGTATALSYATRIFIANICGFCAAFVLS